MQAVALISFGGHFMRRTVAGEHPAIKAGAGAGCWAGPRDGAHTPISGGCGLLRTGLRKLRFLAVFDPDFASATHHIWGLGRFFSRFLRKRGA